MITICALALTTFFSTSVAHSILHPELEARIREVTRQIVEAPDEASLYVTRGELHHRHEEHDAALADFEYAIQIDPSLTHVHVLRATTLHEAGWNRTAVSILDPYRRRHPDDAAASLIAARAHAGLEHADAADDAYASAAKHTENPKPDLLIEWATFRAGLGRVDDALVSLDMAIARFGPLLTLQQPAIELELRRTNPDGALARLETLRGRALRADAWHLQRGRVFEQAGRVADALAAYQAALEVIGSLPVRVRHSPTARTHERLAMEAIERLSPDQP